MSAVIDNGCRLLALVTDGLERRGRPTADDLDPVALEGCSRLRQYPDAGGAYCESSQQTRVRT